MTAWEPPSRLEIEHAGRERLGDRGPARRERDVGGWTTLLPYYRVGLTPS